MIIEIWSDVSCPFCYLGKRRLERALAECPHRDQVTVQWRSFELAPGLVTDPDVRIDEYLARRKGMDRATVRQLNDQLARAGLSEGIVYDFDRIVVANTRNAHRLLQLARDEGRQDAAEERLFRAYFTEGLNVDDRPTLLELGRDIGLNPDRLSEVLANQLYTDRIQADIDEARRLGIRGVPFFRFDRKHVIAGAQRPAVFRETLERAHHERVGADAGVCTSDGVCR